MTFFWSTLSSDLDLGGSLYLFETILDWILSSTIHFSWPITRWFKYGPLPSCIGSRPAREKYKHRACFRIRNSASIMKKIEMNNTLPQKNSCHYLADWQSRLGLHCRPLAALPLLHTGLFRVGYAIVPPSFVTGTHFIHKRVSLFLESSEHAEKLSTNDACGHPIVIFIDFALWAPKRPQWLSRNIRHWAAIMASIFGFLTTSGKFLMPHKYSGT